MPTAQSASCPDGALTKPHAVVTAGSNTYCYDGNGNIVKRDSGSFTLVYDSESRLTTVSGGASATFVYDGDGNRVKGTVGATTTSYVRSHFEWTGSTSTMVKYYYHGGKRVAMRVGASTWYFLLTEHLGSTARTATTSGTVSCASALGERTSTAGGPRQRRIVLQASGGMIQ